MRKSEIRGKHDEDATQLSRRSHPASHPYKEGPLDRANGGAKEDALVDKDEDPRVSQHAKDRIKMADRWGQPTPRVGRSCPASRPGALRGGVVATSPDCFPYMHMAGTNLQGYK